MQTESNSKYLTLALNVRKLTDSLIALVEDGTQSQQLETSLRGVVASLESAGEKTSVKALQERGSFGHFENVSTINEVVKSPDRATLIAKLQNVISSPTEQQRKDSALEAIDFFDALERRALYHYAHPQSGQKIRAPK